MQASTGSRLAALGSFTMRRSGVGMTEHAVVRLGAVAALVVQSLTAQSGDSAVRFPIVEDGLLGYIDERGRVAIPPQFEPRDPADFDLVQFSEGRAGAFRSGGWGFIDTTGAWVVTPRFRNITSFSQGFAAVEAEPLRWGFIDRSGRMAVEPTYLWADRFSEGLAPVEVVLADNDDSFETGYGYLDFAGRMAIAPTFESAGRFSEGLAVVDIGRRSDINASGVVVIKPRFIAAMEFSGGIAAVR